MVERFKVGPYGPGGYGYDEALRLPEHLANEELFQRPFWGAMADFLAGSFVISSGRQYAQLCDMAAMAAILQESAVPIDWEVVDSPLAVEAVRSWQLPGSHTRKPNLTEGLVSGVFQFWWQMQGDALHWRHDPSFELPSREKIERRFEEDCGVPLYQTSSTTIEELAGLDEAVSELRDNPEARDLSCDALVGKAVTRHLTTSLHWLSHKRPRTDRGDVHAVRWRDGMLAASEKPEHERTLYDHLLVRNAKALEGVAGATDTQIAADPELARMYELHNIAVNLYNKTHDEPIEALHRRGRDGAGVYTMRPLGSAGIRATLL